MTLPMDVIKTRLQIELGENIVNSSNNGNTRFVSRVTICPCSNLINMSKGGVDNKFDFKELKNATGFVSSAKEITTFAKGPIFVLFVNSSH